MKQGRTWLGGLCFQDQLTCAMAKKWYYAKNPDVANDPKYGVAAHPDDLQGVYNHYLELGASENRLWPGHFCWHGDRA